MVILALGTNIGDREKNFENAIALISKKIGKIEKQSLFYKTAPVGFASDNFFLNAVISIKTKLSVYQVLKQTQWIEKNIGRRKKSKCKIYTDRVIDIDILAYNNLIISNKRLIIPHPELHFRKFVLEPFAEILPKWKHPILKKSVTYFKQMC
jgi:2-amino-4-hydroxy-6-hydroxymethyldihydropteridine diphosphokinase